MTKQEAMLAHAFTLGALGLAMLFADALDVQCSEFGVGLVLIVMALLLGAGAFRCKN